MAGQQIGAMPKLQRPEISKDLLNLTHCYSLESAEFLRIGQDTLAESARRNSI
jgi:hypothetical protein